MNDVEIVHLYDPPHLMKGIRNNMLNKNLRVHDKPVKKEIEEALASWDVYKVTHQVDAYSTSSAEPELHKITEAHVEISKLHKMSVKHMAQVFSDAMADKIDKLLAVGGRSTKNKNFNVYIR